ncbi:MAG: dTDP-4-dehydrorhamnose 3,5-epimerase [Alphaproteobacteria bacterium]|nr:dTDP-4-dehydrorhamnose 3,5-epimerase [Alphaproteobacteria bacterium]
MQIIDTAIPDVKLIEPRVFGDERGFFMETWNARAWAEAGLGMRFVQDNHSRSSKGVLRGLHYQLGDAVQGKLVRVTAGSVFDVAVDIRRASPTFGQWVGYELSAANKRMLWVPEGFAHGFVTLEDGTDFLYKCTRPYAPAAERAIRWDDPTIGVAWPDIGMAPQLSGKDAVAPLFADAEVFA